MGSHLVGGWNTLTWNNINIKARRHVTRAQTLFSLVTMRTRTDWSKEAHTHSPCLSGLQSRLMMGCVDRETFCRRLSVPATPLAAPSPSFSLLFAGYSLQWQYRSMVLSAGDEQHEYTEFYFGTHYFHKCRFPAPPVVIKMSRFWGKCLTCHIVNFWAFNTNNSNREHK